MHVYQSFLLNDPFYIHLYVCFQTQLKPLSKFLTREKYGGRNF